MLFTRLVVTLGAPAEITARLARDRDGAPIEILTAIWSLPDGSSALAELRRPALPGRPGRPLPGEVVRLILEHRDPMTP